MGGVEVPQAPRGVGRGEGLSPLSAGGRVWVEGCAPSPENVSYFLLIIPYFDAFWHVCVLTRQWKGF